MMIMMNSNNSDAADVVPATKYKELLVKAGLEVDSVGIELRQGKFHLTVQKGWNTVTESLEGKCYRDVVNTVIKRVNAGNDDGDCGDDMPIIWFKDQLSAKVRAMGIALSSCLITLNNPYSPKDYTIVAHWGDDKKVEYSLDEEELEDSYYVNNMIKLIQIKDSTKG